MKSELSKINKQLEICQVNRINSLGKASTDVVAVEEPLQLILQWQQQSVVFTITMRTPGNDIELAVGLLFCEGQITHFAHIQGFDNDQLNQLVVHYQPTFGPNLTDSQRLLTTQSSCGICGKTSLKALEMQATSELDKTPAWLDVKQLGALPDKLRQHQAIFAQTGGVHGAALFDQNYQLLLCKEDVGRHNAVDKVIGAQLISGAIDQGQRILLVSGRLSFELVQKCVMAGYPVLVAVGAPSSLAIAAAQRFDLTLIGFTKPDSFNVYHGQWRLIFE